MTLDRRLVKDLSSLNFYSPLRLPRIPNDKPGDPMDLGAGWYYIPRQAICKEEGVLSESTKEWVSP